MILPEIPKRQPDTRGALAKTRERLSFAMTGCLIVLALLVEHKTLLVQSVKLRAVLCTAFKWGQTP